MKIQDLKENLDEDSFISILFHNDVTKSRYFMILKEYIKNQSKYEGIRDFLLEQKLPNMQFMNFIEECKTMGLIRVNNNEIKLSFDFLNKLEQIKSNWKNYVKSVQ